MKIVQIVTQMEAAGAQKVAYLLHQAFQMRFDSELWFLYTKRPSYAGKQGIRSLLDHPPRSTEYPALTIRLYRELVASSPDVVMTHTHYANVLGQAAAWGAGVPRRIAVHHNPALTFPQAVRRADRFLGRNGAYSEIVAVSDAVAATFQSYPQKYLKLMTTIHNGMEFPRCQTDPNIRARWDIPGSHPLLLSVGRLSKQKNHALLLRALVDVPEAHLAMVGAGELKDELTALAADLGVASRVHFTGELDPLGVVSFLNACDVFVFPSLWEGLPMAAIEALQAGAAIVASDIPATREVVGDAAVLASPGDAATFAGAIRSVLEDPVLANSLRQRAKLRALEFTARSMIDGYSQLVSREATRSPAATVPRPATPL